MSAIPSNTLFPERFPAFQPQDFVFQIATSEADRAAFFRLRQQVFCEEQQILRGEDRDPFDDAMIPIVAKPLLAGIEDRVIGVVRIDEREPGVWFGSRLAVDPPFRRIRRFSPAATIRNGQPCHAGLGAIGAALIYKAVSTALLRGCSLFLAQVQARNRRFFERLRWEAKAETTVYGRPHVLMQADLRHYQPLGRVA